MRALSAVAVPCGLQSDRASNSEANSGGLSVDARSSSRHHAVRGPLKRLRPRCLRHGRQRDSCALQICEVQKRRLRLSAGRQVRPSIPHPPDGGNIGTAYRVALGRVRYILAKRNLSILERFVASNVLLAFDFDGTLAPIVRDPAAARLRASTRRLMRRVANRYTCVVISGRARHDLAARIGSLPIVHLAGNHGLEPWAPYEEYRAQVQGWIRQLTARLAHVPGIVVEDKSYSVTVHYRNARHPRLAASAIRRALRTLRGARSLGGDHAVALVPRGAPTKGAALERVCRLFASDSAIWRWRSG